MSHALRTRVRDEREAGFTLIEILVAMVLMAIIMSSLAVFFIGAQRSGSALRIRENATVIADEAMDRVHSIAPGSLFVNRDQTSVQAEWATPVTGVDLSSTMWQWDTTSVPAPTAGTGANANLTALPTTPQTVTVNKNPYTVSYYVGNCFIPRGGGACTKLPPTDPITMDRAIVAVNWNDPGTACPQHTCAYVIASLISPAGDPTFNVNQVLVDTTPPSTPTLSGCKAVSSPYTDVAIQLNAWSPSTDASGVARYDIYRGTSATYSTMTKIGSQTGTGAFTDYGFTPGLVPNTVYYYAVIAYDTVGNAAGPQVPTGTVTNPQEPFVASCSTAPDTFAPSTPVAPTASSPTTSSLVVTWPAGTDEYKVNGYLLFRTGVTAPIATLGAGVLTYTDTGLSPYTYYTYQTETIDPAGNVSAKSPASVQVRTTDTTPPTVPASLTATAKPWPALEIDLDWADSTDNVATTGYNVYRSTTGAAGPWTQLTPAPSVSNFADTTVASNTKYYYYVTAHDAVPNTSGASAVVSASTPDTLPPSAPTNLVAGTRTPTTIPLTWTASTDNVGVVGYYVYRNGATTPTYTVTSGTSVTDTGLTQLTGYTYAVKAYDAAGNVSASSIVLSTSTTDGIAPSTPTLSSSTKTMTSVTLNWTTSTDNVAVTGYAVFRNGTQIGTTSSTVYTYVDSAGLTPGTAYTYTVEAYDAAGNYSTASNALPVTTTADTSPPTKVIGLKGTSTLKNTVTIAWTASTDNVAVASYQIFVGGTLNQTVTSPTTSYYYTALANSATYLVTVYAVDTSNNVSPVSATLTCVVSSTGNVSCS